MPRTSTRIDPNLKRTHQWQYVVELPHEPMPRFSISATYHHERFSQLCGTGNRLVAPTVCNLVTIANLLTGEPPTV